MTTKNRSQSCERKADTKRTVREPLHIGSDGTIGEPHPDDAVGIGLLDDALARFRAGGRGIGSTATRAYYLAHLLEMVARVDEAGDAAAPVQQAVDRFVRRMWFAAQGLNGHEEERNCLIDAIGVAAKERKKQPDLSDAAVFLVGVAIVESDFPEHASSLYKSRDAFLRAVDAWLRPPKPNGGSKFEECRTLVKAVLGSNVDVRTLERGYRRHTRRRELNGVTRDVAPLFPYKNGVTCDVTPSRGVMVSQVR